MKRRKPLKPLGPEASESPVFVWYVKPPKPIKQVKMTIRLQSDYQLLVNVAASRQLGQFSAIRLCYALKEKILQLHSASTDEEGAVAIPPSAKTDAGLHRSFSLNVPDYLKQWQLEELRGQYFVVELADGILQADLNTPLPADHSKR
ncbi:MAG: hypothetical protein ACRYFS_12300 [Janthinobacterium lividum]